MGKYQAVMSYEQGGRYKVTVEVSEAVMDEASRLRTVLDMGLETLELTPPKAKNQYPFAVVERGNGDVRLRVTKRG